MSQWTGFEVLELLVEVHAADETHDVEAGVLGQVGGVLGDLHHQLAGRRDDQARGSPM
jgi:predicted trehalose synthase